MKNNQTVPLLISKPPECMPWEEINLVVSQQKVSDSVFDDTGIQISECTIQQYVSEGQAGESPKKKGQIGTLSKGVFETLAGAFGSLFCINQLNGKSC